jgi:8-oxo-dGTP diphosphatase
MSYIKWLRDQIGRRRTLLVFSTIVLRDADGGVLLQLRNDFKSWGLPGGILEPGENILDCARRELLEETGLLAGSLRLVGVYSDPRYESTYPNGDQVQQFTVCFEGQRAGGEMRADGIENSEQRFIAPERLPFDELPDFYRDMLGDALTDGAPAFQPPFSRPGAADQIQTIRPLLTANGVFICPGAMAVVVNERGCLLLGQRAEDGFWSLPGGFMAIGENDAYTAQRETGEETGLEIEIERLMGVHSPAEAWRYPNGDETQAVVTVYRAHPIGGAERPDQTETLRLDWLTPQEMLQLDVPPPLARLHRAVAANLDRGVFVV